MSRLIGKLASYFNNDNDFIDDVNKNKSYNNSKKVIKRVKEPIKIINDITDEVEYARYIIKNNNKIKRYRALVFQGGGMRGIVYLGFLKAFSKLGKLNDITFFAGTSVGALMALGMYLGYSVNYFIKWVMRDDFIESLFGYDINYLESMDLQKLINVGTCFGMIPTDHIEAVIISLIANAPILKGRGTGYETFRDLYNITGKTYMCTGTDLNYLSAYYFSHDLSPDVCVYQATTISLCVPFFFKPVFLDDCFWVDGGVVQNLPIDMTKRYIDKDEILCCCITTKRYCNSSGNLKLNKWVNKNEILNPYYSRPYGAPPRKFDPVTHPCIKISGIGSYLMAYIQSSQKSEMFKPDTDTSVIAFNCSTDLLPFNFNIDYYTKKKYIEYAYKKTIKYFS